MPMRRQEQARQAADGEQADEAQRVEHRRVEARSMPLWSVAVQLKTLIADGIAIRKLRIENTMPAYTALPADEHVVAPHEKAEHGDRQAGEGDEAVAEDAVAREAAISSLITPIAGSTMMYTAGCE